MKTSIVVVTYDMARELPRTLTSLAVPFQRGVEAADYEVIVVDNGSPEPVSTAVFDGFPGTWRVLRVDPAPPAPARAANLGIDASDGDYVGLFIDGARMASPGLLLRAMQARALAERPVVMTLGWHLGATRHIYARDAGYDQDDEDRLLAEIQWEQDGER